MVDGAPSEISFHDPSERRGLSRDNRRMVAWTILIVLHLMTGILFLSDRSPGTNAALTGFPLDDTWIHLVYGRSLAEYGMPFYNDGELEAGFTSPMWMIFTGMAELVHKAGVAPAYIILKLFSLFVSMIGSIVLYELCLTVSQSIYPSLFVAGLFAALPMNAFSQLSGMEVNLTALLITVACLSYILKRFRYTGYSFAAAYLSRPETIVFLPVVILMMVFTERRSVKDKPLLLLRYSAYIAGPTIIVGLSWMTYCLFVNGHPLPNTFYVKYGTGVSIPGIGRALREFMREISPFKFGAGIILYIFGFAVLVRRREFSGITISLFPWIYIAAVGGSRPLPQGCGSYFYWWRYWAPGVALLALPLVSGAALLWETRSGIGGVFRDRDGWIRPFRTLAIVIGLLMVGPYIRDFPTFSHTFAWNCQNINEVNVAIGRWIDEHVGQDEAVLVNDAGAIRYFGKRKTIDLFGLNNHELLFSPSRGKVFRTDAVELEKLARHNSGKYLVIFPPWFKQLIQSDEFKMLFDPLYFFESEHYTVVPGDAQSKMFIFMRKSP